MTAIALYLLVAAYAGTCAVAITHRLALVGGRLRAGGPLFYAVVVVAALLWIGTVPLAIWGVLSDAYRQVGGDEVALGAAGVDEIGR